MKLEGRLGGSALILAALVATNCSGGRSAKVDGGGGNLGVAGDRGSGGNSSGSGGTGVGGSSSASGGTGVGGRSSASGGTGVGGKSSASGGTGVGGGSSAGGGAGAGGGPGASGGPGGRSGATGLGGAVGDDGGTDAGAPVDAACAEDAAQQVRFVDMNVRGEGFAAHEARTIYLFTRTGSLGILGSGSAVVRAGAFSVRFPNGYDRGAAQQVSWFIDEDGDGACNVAMGDHLGYTAVDPVDLPEPFDVTIEDNHAGDLPKARGACDGTRPFEEMSDIDVTATGFASHDGQTIRLLTRTIRNGAIFGRGQSTVTGGAFSFHFPRGYSQFTYQEIFWFLDVDGDGSCTASDHRGYLATNAFTPTGNAPVTIPLTDNHMLTSARQADVCVVMNGCQLAP